ncbi:MAG: hypothetical protein LBH43_09290 [Treponema sp.]|jgi:hypothetical protein|nr:hypothetical protein [Treponema sp.]
MRKDFKEKSSMIRAEGIQVELRDASQTADEIAGKLWGLMQKMPIFNM